MRKIKKKKKCPITYDWLIIFVLVVSDMEEWMLKYVKMGFKQDNDTKWQNLDCNNLLIPDVWKLVCEFIPNFELCYGCILENIIHKKTFDFPQTTVCKGKNIIWDIQVRNYTFQKEFIYRLEFIICKNKNERTRFFEINTQDAYAIITKDKKGFDILLRQICSKLFSDFKKECDKNYDIVQQIVLNSFDLFADHFIQNSFCIC